MNKQDLIAKVAEAADISKAKAGVAVNSTFAGIQESLQSGEPVTLIGFGTFSVAHRAESMGQNPRTGERIKIPASKRPKFKAGKALKEAVNK